MDKIKQFDFNGAIILWLNKQAKKKKNKIKQEAPTKTVANRQGWIWLFKVVAFGAIIFLLWYSLDYTKPSNFPIQQIKIISSYQHIDKKTLQNVIIPYINNGFFYLNVIGMKRRLLKLPWIYAISVQRKWPDTIVINIIEQHAVLQWGVKALVNHKGTIFKPLLTTFPTDLPIIFGPDKREFEIFTLYQQAKKSFALLNLFIKQLFFNPQHYWEILLSNNTIIYLKEVEPLKQIDFLVVLYPKITADHKYPPKSIDLRYNNDGLAVRWE